MKHQVGDLVIRYYFEKPILGILQAINDTEIFPFQYEIEWLDPPDGVCVSLYGGVDMREGKRRLNETLAQYR
jgi:hypothetical protein